MPHDIDPNMEKIIESAPTEVLIRGIKEIAEEYTIENIEAKEEYIGTGNSVLDTKTLVKTCEVLLERLT